MPVMQPAEGPRVQHAGAGPAECCTKTRQMRMYASMHSLHSLLG
eukprot:CAMPEP_0113240758 /NCGR_PEP_ID=MMETSP0008_2-20120614/6438_1 /TAXON_ID=97485 /ORGANISM="Prymnesium parvum" /LENGTH=43 /DNA_ID=CAMNT_0000088129 /DNA_START=270 /DNA_END=401 /DNA_ORIENTATION=- /assembly_acc=CAM_ASM_000153